MDTKTNISARTATATRTVQAVGRRLGEIDDEVFKSICCRRGAIQRWAVATVDEGYGTARGFGLEIMAGRRLGHSAVAPERSSHRFCCRRGAVTGDPGVGSRGCGRRLGHGFGLQTIVGLN
ncbi:hypothetical protein Adt_13714 [Abeliophyllum distichum]|uniref:Uncharacterized protein n=1 Tax=Abeliophyllum distichum TaxID=126358 RepID=A0ABD1TXL2_9LAMI